MYKGASRIYPAYTRGWGAGARRAPLLVRTFAVRCSLAGPSLQIEKTSISAKTLVLEFRYLKHPWTTSEETVTIETLARCNSWLVDVVRAKHGSL